MRPPPSYRRPHHLPPRVVGKALSQHSSLAALSLCFSSPSLIGGISSTGVTPSTSEASASSIQQNRDKEKEGGMGGGRWGIGRVTPQTGGLQLSMETLFEGRRSSEGASKSCHHLHSDTCSRIPFRIKIKVNRMKFCSVFMISLCT